MKCMRCIVSGRVQGVFYRASTQQQAVINHITGHVRNLKTGDVEVIMCGEEDNLNKLHKWLRQGPKYAEVVAVESQDIELAELPDHFSIGW